MWQILVFCAAIASGGTETSNPQTTQSVMQKIFADMAEVLPESFDLTNYSAKALGPKLKALANDAKALDSHVAGRSLGLKFRASQLAADAQDVATSYERGYYQRSQFLLHQLTQACTGCHAQFPARPGVPEPSKFFTDLKVDQMSHQSQAKIYLMSRQLDQALAVYDKIVLNPQNSASLRIDTLGRYVLQVYRMRRDGEQVEKILTSVLPTFDKSTPHYAQVESWSKDAKKFGSKAVASPEPLKVARELVADAKNSMTFPRDKSRNIPLWLATSHLTDFLEAGPTDAGQIAEAYYLMGFAETAVASSDWSIEAEYFLEQSIRLQPLGEHARESLRLLEEQIVYGFTGSAGTQVPADKQALLADLRKLVAATPKR